MKGGSLTRYDPNRGTPTDSGSGRPGSGGNQRGGFAIKGIDGTRMIQSLPGQVKAKKRKAVAALNRTKKKAKRLIRDIFE